MSKSGWHVTTETDFDIVKTLLNAGKSVAEVAELTKRSTSTIYYMNKSDTYKDYKKMVDTYKRGINKGTKKNEPELKQTEDVSLRIATALEEIEQTLKKLLLEREVNRR